LKGTVAIAEKNRQTVRKAVGYNEVGSGVVVDIPDGLTIGPRSSGRKRRRSLEVSIAASKEYGNRAGNSYSQILSFGNFLAECSTFCTAQ
jgi:hypothetical protein